jgi:hypothetical protein
MAVDFWADKYWNGQYFNVQYFGTGEADLNAMSGSASGSATVTGTLSNGAATAEIVPIGSMYGGASYKPKRKDWEKVKALLFPENRPRKKDKRQAHVRKLAVAVKEVLPEIAPYEPIPQMAVLRQAVDALYRLPEQKRQKIATPKAFAKAVFAEVKRIEDDEEDLILALIAA